jgi:glucosylceramidase
MKRRDVRAGLHVTGGPSRHRAPVARLLVATSATAAVLVALVAVAAPVRAQVPEAQVLTSTADGSVRLASTTAVASPAEASVPADVVVHGDQPRQHLHGVGAALTESSAHLLIGLPASEREAALRALFDPAQGGLSVLRLVIGASDFSLTHRSLAEGPGPDPELRSFSIDDDRDDVLPVLREILAINPGIELVASPWSAPGWMKDTGNYLFGTLRQDHERTFARYLVKYLEAYRSEGIRIGWLTVQNEPAAVQLTYPSMLMSPGQQTRLVRDHLGPELAAAGLDTRVLAWDHNWCDAEPPGGCVGPAPPSFPFEVLEAAGDHSPFGGTGLHCYGGDQVTANEALHQRWPNLQIWQTECSGGEWQGTREQAFASTGALVMRDRNHWSNATLLWNLALDPDHGPHLGGCDTCRGVITIDPTTNTWTPELDHDVLAGFARFAPKGSSALASTTAADTGLEASATCSPSTVPAVTVWNPGDARQARVRFEAGGTDPAVDVDVALPAGSLTTVAAPAGVGCTPADPPPPPTTTPTTLPIPAEGMPAPPAVPVVGTPRFTG